MTDDNLATEAEDLLAELQRIRHSTRQTMLTTSWAMFLLWGVIFLGSVLAFSSSVEAMSLYWVLAAPIGAVASFALGARHDKVAGSSASVWPYVVTAAVMFVGTFGSFFVFDGGLAVLVWWLFLVAGFATFALLDRQRELLVALAFLTIWGVVAFLFIESEATLYHVLAGTFGGLLLGAGAGLRMVRR